MFIARVGTPNKHYVLSKSIWNGGAPRRIHIATLGKTEKQAAQKLKALLRNGTIEQSDYDRLVECLDTDIWGTPSWVARLVSEAMGWIDLDPCTQPDNPIQAARFYTKAQNGLTQPWEGNVYCNPPFSTPTPWIKRLVKGYQDGQISQGFLLAKAGVMHNVGTGSLIQTANIKGLWKGRLKFEPLRKGKTSNSPDFDVAIAYWGDHADSIRALFGPYVWF